MALSRASFASTSRSEAGCIGVRMQHDFRDGTLAWPAPTKLVTPRSVETGRCPDRGTDSFADGGEISLLEGGCCERYPKTIFYISSGRLGLHQLFKY